MPIEWRQAMAVDGAVIDDDHRRLIGIINSFERAHTTKWDLTTVLDDLRAYSIKHFRREEDLQRQMGFPEAEAHHQEHERLLERLEQIASEFAKSSGDDLRGPIQRTSQLLNDWLVAHIISCDLKMKPYLKARPKY